MMLAQELQRYIRTTDAALAVLCVHPGRDKREIRAIRRRQRRAAWWLSWLAGFPRGRIAAPDLVTELIVSRWLDSLDAGPVTDYWKPIGFLTLRQIREALACTYDNPCDTCREGR